MEIGEKIRGFPQNIENPFPQEKVDKIASIFSLAVPQVDEDELEAREVCFQAVLGAINEGEWQKVHAVRDVVIGLRDASERTLYSACIDRGVVESVREILQRQLAEGFSCGEYEYALHTAARRGNIALIALLWKHGYCIDEVDAEGKTPLHAAIEAGEDEAVEALVKNGASTSLPFRQKVNFSPLSWAVRRGEIECFDAIIREGRDIDLRSEEVESIGNLLHVAIHFGQFSMLEHLLIRHDEKTQRLIQRRNTLRQTPLMLAAYMGDCWALSLFHGRKVDLEMVDGQGQTAMHWAVRGKNKEAVETLFSLGGRPSAIDTEGRKPIDLVLKAWGQA